MTKSSEPTIARVVEVADWEQIATLIAYFSYYNGIPWLFRGATKLSYTLVPSIGRDERKPKPLVCLPDRRVPYSARDEKAVFSMFMQGARAHLPASYTKVEWLAIAQHFGVPTRMLDWTDSLLPALWFATGRAGQRDAEDARVWYTGKTVSSRPDVDPFKVRTPQTYRPPHIAPRIAAQGSVLMICPKPTEAPRLDDLGEIIIKRSFQFQLRKRLDALGINERTMFADLGGLGKHLAWRYRNNWLAGYRE